MFKANHISFLDKLTKYEELGRKPKVIIAVAESREMAEEIKQNVVDQIDFYDHNDKC